MNLRFWEWRVSQEKPRSDKQLDVPEKTEKMGDALIRIGFKLTVLCVVAVFLIGSVRYALIRMYQDREFGDWIIGKFVDSGTTLLIVVLLIFGVKGVKALSNIFK